MAKNSIFNKDSRYVQGGQTTAFSNRLGWWERYTFQPAFDDHIITLTAEYAQRPDKLAFDLYGKASLMWVILQYNNINDINEEFIEGNIVKAPTRERLILQVLNKTSKDAIVEL